WIEHQPSKLTVRGSSPCRVTLLKRKEKKRACNFTLQAFYLDWSLSGFLESLPAILDTLRYLFYRIRSFRNGILKFHRRRKPGFVLLHQLENCHNRSIALSPYDISLAIGLRLPVFEVHAIDMIVLCFDKRERVESGGDVVTCIEIDSVVLRLRQSLVPGSEGLLQMPVISHNHFVPVSDLTQPLTM